jgi:hypothetical protein
MKIVDFSESIPQASQVFAKSMLNSFKFNLSSYFVESACQSATKKKHSLFFCNSSQFFITPKSVSYTHLTLPTIA